MCFSKMYYCILNCLVLFTFSINAAPQFFEKCSFGNDIDKYIKCATVKVLKTVERAQGQDFFEILPGVTLRSNISSLQRKAKGVDWDLPITSTNRTSGELFEMLLSASSRFISNRILKIELPLNIYSAKMSRALQEGRGKMKKMMGSLIFGLGSKMMSMVPIMFGGLVVLTTKALLVGKLAFVLSLVMFIQMFFNGRIFSYGGTYGIPPTYGVPSTYGTNFGSNSLGGWGTSAQYPYARSIDIPQKERDDE